MSGRSCAGYRPSTGAPLSEKVATAAADLVIGFAIGSLVNQETGVRGFALSANESFLQPYVSGLTEQRDTEATLRGLLAACPAAAVISPPRPA